MKRNTAGAARGSRGSAEKRALALLGDGTPLFHDGVETRHEAQAAEGKLHFSLFFSTPYFNDGPYKIIKIQKTRVKRKTYFCNPSVTGCFYPLWQRDKGGF
jgi:hypothetical protein